MGNLEVNGESAKKAAAESVENSIQAQKRLVDELKLQWKQLWSERLNDKVRAEDISGSTYTHLKVERGTIIHASRDFKPLNFKEILENNRVDNPDSYVQPNVAEGGWTKFAKNEIIAPTKMQRPAKNQTLKGVAKKVALQPKKGGRGWLHVT